MTPSALYNNVGLTAIAMAFTIQEKECLPISNAMVIFPIISHRKMLLNLAHASVTARSIEQYVLDKPEFFSNFSDRYYDGLIKSINALQLLVSINVVRIDHGWVRSVGHLEYSPSMGTRAKKIHLAANNIAVLVGGDPASLHLNTRIEL